MEVEELCRKLRPVLGRKADAMYRAYLTEDYAGKREIQSMLEITYAKILAKDLTEDKILLIPPPEGKCSGEYPVGKVVYNEKELHNFALKEEELLQHCAILGRSGSGKTNTAYVLIAGLLLKKKPFLILDWKRNYRDLWGMLPEKRKKDILVFTVGRSISPFRFNPLIPPQGTPPEIWLKKLIEIIAHAHYCGDGVMYLLQKAIDSVYKAFEVYENTQEKWPTMHDVLSWLENYTAKGREAGWMSSTLRAIQSMCFGEMGKVLNAGNQTGIEELLKKNVIMELDTLSNNDKIFFIESLLLWIHHFRMAEGKREILKHVILIEEAHHILVKQKQDLQGGETVVDIIIREIRELGEGLILIDQVPSQMSNVALANTYTTIGMNLKHQSDVYSVSRCMLLDTGQKEYLGKLEVGFAICKLQGRIFKPFLLKIPLIKVNKGMVTDEEVKKLMSNNEGFFTDTEPNTSPISDIKEKENHNASSYSYFSKKKAKQTNPEVITVISPEDKIDKNEKKLLIDILNTQSSSTFTRYERLGFNPRLGNELKGSLTDKGLIKVESIPTSNARVKVMELTDKGKSLLKKSGHKIESGTNGSTHRYWKYRIADYYKDQGYNVEVEKDAVDIVVKKDNKKIAIEIETGKSNTIWNIKRDLNLGFKDIIVVATSKKIEEKINERVKKEALDKNKKVRIINAGGYVK